MHYYPFTLPHINLDNLRRKNIKHYKNNLTLLHSSEGHFQVRKGQIFQVHFNDDENSVKKNINGMDFICDSSTVVWTPSNKLPYEFIRKEITETCFELGSVKFYIHDENGKIVHCYFSIKDNQIHDIEEDISHLMKCAQA